MIFDTKLIKPIHVLYPILFPFQLCTFQCKFEMCTYDRKLDTATTLKRLQVAEVSLICTGWRRTEDYGEPRRSINMNIPLDDDDV